MYELQTGHRKCVPLGTGTCTMWPTQSRHRQCLQGTRIILVGSVRQIGQFLIVATFKSSSVDAGECWLDELDVADVKEEMVVVTIIEDVGAACTLEVADVKEEMIDITTTGDVGPACTWEIADVKEELFDVTIADNGATACTREVADVKEELSYTISYHLV